jgi:hypothetical protein
LLTWSKPLRVQAAESCFGQCKVVIIFTVRVHGAVIETLLARPSISSAILADEGGKNGLGPSEKTGFRYGILFGVQFGRRLTILLLGSSLAPTAILDSWTYLHDRQVLQFGLVRDTIEFMLDSNVPGVFTYYWTRRVGSFKSHFSTRWGSSRGGPSITTEEVVGMSRGVRGGRGD